jgi:hypothetical protein
MDEFDFGEELTAWKDEHPPERHCAHPRGWDTYECKHGSLISVCLRCHRCDACRKVEAARTIMRLKYGCELSGRSALLTLTAHKLTTWPEVMRKWTQMIRWMRTKTPSLAYAVVKEEGKHLRIKHLHVVLLSWNYIPQSQISKEWRKLTGSYVVDVRAIDGPGAARYVAKYLGKSRLAVGKTVTFSKTFPNNETHLSLKWCHRSNSIADFYPVTHATKSGILIHVLKPSCDCFADPADLSDGERLWLASRPGHWSPPSQAVVDSWCLGKPASASSSRPPPLHQITIHLTPCSRANDSPAPCERGDVCPIPSKSPYLLCSRLREKERLGPGAQALSHSLAVELSSFGTLLTATWKRLSSALSIAAPTGQSPTRPPSSLPGIASTSPSLTP